MIISIFLLKLCSLLQWVVSKRWPSLNNFNLLVEAMFSATFHQFEYMDEGKKDFNLLVEAMFSATRDNFFNSFTLIHKISIFLLKLCSLLQNCPVIAIGSSLIFQSSCWSYVLCYNVAFLLLYYLYIHFNLLVEAMFSATRKA